MLVASRISALSLGKMPTTSVRRAGGRRRSWRTQATSRDGGDEDDPDDRGVARADDPAQRFGSMRLVLHLDSFRGAGAEPERAVPGGPLDRPDCLPYIIPPTPPIPLPLAASSGSATIASV